MNDDFKQKNHENYIVLNTKVAPAIAKRFRKICAKKGIDIYMALQMMVDTFVRYTDDQHNLSPDLEQLMSIFEHMEGWEDAFNLADPSANHEIYEAIYFIGADRNKKGLRAILVHRPFFGNWTETVNVQDILNRSIEVLSPDRYKRLSRLAQDMDCSSIVELLDVMIATMQREVDAQAYREEFEDAARSDFGRHIEFGHKPVQRHHITMDMFDEAEQKRNRDNE